MATPLWMQDPNSTPQWMLDKISSMSQKFTGVQTQQPSQQFHEVPEAAHAAGAGAALEVTVSNCAQSVNGFQVLTYTVDLTGFVVTAGFPVSLNLGSLPINGMVIGSAVWGQNVVENPPPTVEPISLIYGLDVGPVSPWPLPPSFTQLSVPTLLAPTWYTGYGGADVRFAVERGLTAPPAFLNASFSKGGVDTTYTSGELTIAIFYIQMDPNNNASDGYPSGGVDVGPCVVPIYPTPSNPAPAPDPIIDLGIFFNLLPPSSQGYALEYKPSFNWQFAASSLAISAMIEFAVEAIPFCPQPSLRVPIVQSWRRNATFPLDNDCSGAAIALVQAAQLSQTIDQYLNFRLYELDGVTPEGEFQWKQLMVLTHQPIETATPLGLLLNPFPFLFVNQTYKIEVDEVVHVDGFPELTTSSSLVWGGDPYPVPPPPPVTTLPGPPTDLAGQGGANVVLLTWDPPSDTGGTIIDSYVVEQAPDNGAGVPGVYQTIAPDASDVFWLALALEGSTNYWFRVSATNSVGTGSPTSGIMVETGPDPVGPPSVPINLKGVPGQDRVALSWQAPTYNGGRAVVSYSASYAQLAGASPPPPTSPSWTAAPGPIVDVNTTITGLTSNLQYWFRVNATNGLTGPWSVPLAVTTESAPPTPPTEPANLVVTGETKEMLLAWEAPLSTGGSPLISYQIDQAPDAAGSPGVWVNAVKVVDSSTLNTSISSLTASTTYWFRVSANNVAGFGLPTSPVSGTTNPNPVQPPSAPRQLVAKAGVKEATLTWLAPATTGGEPIVTYQIQRSVTSATAGFATIANVGAPSQTYTDGGLADDTEYWWRVAATNNPPGAIVFGAWSNVADATTPKQATIPGAPTQVSGVGGSQQVSLTWKAPADNGGALVTSYNPQYSTSATGPWTSAPTVSTTKTVVTGLADATQYWFQVRAVNSVGPGPYSTPPATATTTGTPATAPGPPQDLTATPGDKRIQLNWKVPAYDGGKTVIDYKSEMSEVPAPYTWVTIASATTGLSYTKTGLEDGKNYWFRVSARNSVGYGQPSNIVESSPVAPDQCDPDAAGTVMEWNGSTSPSDPVNGSQTYPNGIGASVPWTATGMTYGIPKTANPPGPGCVTKWLLDLYSSDGKTKIASWPTTSPEITFPRAFYVVKTAESAPGKKPTTFIVGALEEGTQYLVYLSPQPSDPSYRVMPPRLVIPITTGTHYAPPPPDNCDDEAKGTVTQWNGTVGSSQQINGIDKNKPTNVAAKINWSDTGMTYGRSKAAGGPGCVAYWNLSVSTTATPPVTIATNTTQILGLAPIIIANFVYPPPPSPEWTWEVSGLKPDVTYNWTAQPVRNDPAPGALPPPSITTTFKMGNPYTPKPPPGPPVPPVPDSGNLPQTYITTYGIPSWGQTTMVDLLSQQFFSTGQSLTAGKNQDAITVAYQQQQNWGMVRSWAKAFFHQYAALIAQNEQMVNAMILMGDWATLFPAAGLPVQPSTLTDGGASAHGQVAGSQVNWDIMKGIYSYCSPNGPVDFGLSYNPDSSVAPPAGVTQWWENDPDQIGCPLVLDFFIPLAQLMKAKNRVIEISVNGDVSKNGNADNYHSLDAGNYTAADLRRGPFERTIAPLDLILEGQEYTPDQGGVPLTNYWGPITTPPTNKTQQVAFKIASADYTALVAGDGAPGKPMSQNNLSTGIGQSATGTIVSSTYDAPSSTATFIVHIPMTTVPRSGKRIDGIFSVTDTDPTAKYNINAKLYFAAPTTDFNIANPTGVGTLYDVTLTNLSAGAFKVNWVVQQSTNTGGFPGTAMILDPTNINAGGIIGQIDETAGIAPTLSGYPGTITVQMAIEHGVAVSDLRPYLTSAPGASPPVYDTNFKHRCYQVPNTWLPGQPIPAPVAPYYMMRVATVGVPCPALVQTVFNYSSLPMLGTPDPARVTATNGRAPGTANTTPATGGWLPANWDVIKGDVNFPAHWNVSLDQNQLPATTAGPAPAAMIGGFADPGALIMGGGNVFIGTGVGAFTGRASYFDETTVTSSTTRPELVTTSGTNTGANGTYFSPTTYTGKEVGFPLDNLHQLYVLIYRINQKVMKFNWTHSKANPNYDPTSPYAGLEVPMITHVHHDKESYQVNKDPTYPECDETTGDVKTDWLMLGKTQANIDAMGWDEFLVWKQSRRQTSVAYEKYLFNRYMPAQYLPDWRTGGKSITHTHYMPLNSGCTIPNTGNSSADGFTRTGGELLWDSTKPWNVNQQRNFGLDADPTGSRTSTTVKEKGIGNYSNDFSDRRLGDTLDGIQRYQMGWVNYTVTSWAYATFVPGQDVGFTVTSVTAGVSAGLLCLQPVSGSTGVIKSAAGTSVVITSYQGKWTPTDPITVYSGGAGAPVTQAVTGIPTSEAQKLQYTSQGTNEAYQELYNIGEVKPPVGQVWLYDTATEDKNKKKVVPSPLLTLSVDPSGYTNGTVEGAGNLTADIAAIYNTSSIVLQNLKKNGQPATFPTMFSVKETVTLKKAGKPDLPAMITDVYKPTAAAPFPADFIKMLDPTNNNEYGVSPFELPDAASGTMIPNGLGSACIPGNNTPNCPAGVSVICPDVPPEKVVGPYYKLNCVTNTLIGRIFSKYSSTTPGGSGADWPFLGANAVNSGSNIKSPALTDLWLRYDAINIGIIPLDGRGFNQTGQPNGPQPCDGTYAPFNSPWVGKDGTINLTSMYSNSNLEGDKVVAGSPTDWAPPVGPRQAIALFANEYIGGALTVNPQIRPGAAGSGWTSVVKGDHCPDCPGVDYLPGTNTGTNGWVGSRAMEVYVYAQLVNDPLNKAMVGTDAKTSASAFTNDLWKLAIRSKDQAAVDFDTIGFSDAANGWAGEYNGLSSLQGEGTTGFSHMKDFLKSCGSMMTGSKKIGNSRVGLYTIGFCPETWWTSSGTTNYKGIGYVKPEALQSSD